MSTRIYVASLSDYNSGVLHGEWIDVTDKDTMLEEIAAMLRESKYPNVMVECPDCEGEIIPGIICQTCKGKGEVPSAEEWAVHDYECDAGELDLGEHPDLRELCELAKAIEEHGKAFLDWHNEDPNYHKDANDFEEQYLGEFDSLADYVQEHWENCGFKAEPWPHPSNYIDWENMARDWERGGDVTSIRNENGKVWIFNCN